MFAYPNVARYSGTGSIDDAASFRAAEGPRFDDDFDWLGRFH